MQNSHTLSKQSQDLCFGHGSLDWELPRWLSGKESACNVGDMGFLPGSGRFLEEELATHS